MKEYKFFHLVGQLPVAGATYEMSSYLPLNSINREGLQSDGSGLSRRLIPVTALAEEETIEIFAIEGRSSANAVTKVPHHEQQFSTGSSHTNLVHDRHEPT